MDCQGSEKGHNVIFYVSNSPQNHVTTGRLPKNAQRKAREKSEVNKIYKN